jgi:hypothetical protein
VNHSEFAIGIPFYTLRYTKNGWKNVKWRCTDIGTRTIIAIEVDEIEPRNNNGPPYSIQETVFDEYDMGSCEIYPLIEE